jgi:hopanoid C-3 methylase
VALALARLARKELPAVRTVLGGHHATVAAADFDDEAVHAVVRGEGCAPFRTIVERAASGEGFEGIPGVRVPGGASTADGWPLYPDPATLPVPRHDLWDARRYRSVWTAEGGRSWQPLFVRVASARTSWGCRMQCTFCVVPMLSQGKHRPRPVELVADEIAALAADHVYFVDDENFIDEDHAMALADALEARGVRKRYFAWTRATTVLRSPELLRRWRQIGLDCAFLGFEFTRDDELKAVRKGSTVAANERALDDLRAMGVAVHAAFMLRPEYEEEDFAHLAAYVRSLPPVQCSFTVCTPSPGSADYAGLAGRFWVDDPHALHDCMHPLTPTRLPLRRFSKLYARQVAAGIANTPVRADKRLLRPGDAIRVVAAQHRYVAGYRNLYRDYPRELWDAAPGGA